MGGGGSLYRPKVRSRALIIRTPKIGLFHKSALKAVGLDFLDLDSLYRTTGDGRLRLMIQKWDTMTGATPRCCNQQRVL